MLLWSLRAKSCPHWGRPLPLSAGLCPGVPCVDRPGREDKGGEDWKDLVREGWDETEVHGDPHSTPSETEEEPRPREESSWLKVTGTAQPEWKRTPLRKAGTLTPTLTAEPGWKADFGILEKKAPGSGAGSGSLQSVKPEKLLGSPFPCQSPCSPTGFGGSFLTCGSLETREVTQ